MDDALVPLSDTLSAMKLDILLDAELVLLSVT
jgi:hypothetical protein